MAREEERGTEWKLQQAMQYLFMNRDVTETDLFQRSPIEGGQNESNNNNKTNLFYSKCFSYLETNEIGI